MEDWPEAVATFFDINITSAQLMLSLAIIMFVVLPPMILSKGKNAVTIWVIFTFLGECIALALGWLPLWIMIMTIAVTSLAGAVQISKVVTGG